MPVDVPVDVPPDEVDVDEVDEEVVGLVDPVAAVVVGDGFVVEPVTVDDTLCSTIAGCDDGVTAGLDGLDVVWTTCGATVVSAVGALALVGELLRLTGDAVVVTSAVDCVDVKVDVKVDGSGAGAGPGGPGGSTGGPPTPYGPGTWVPSGRPNPSSDKPLSMPVGIDTTRLTASASGFGKYSRLKGAG